jgi:hypothetical protein
MRTRAHDSQSYSHKAVWPKRSALVVGLGGVGPSADVAKAEALADPSEGEGFVAGPVSVMTRSTAMPTLA